MSAVQALKAASAAGVRLGIDGKDLTLEADAAPPPSVMNLLTCHRADVIALLRTWRDSWSGEDWRAFFDERAGIAEFDGGLPREQAEAACLRLLRRRVAQPQSGALVALQLPPLRRGRAGPRPAAAVRSRDYRPRLAAFSLLVGLVRRQTRRGHRRLSGNGDRGTHRVSKRFR